MDRFICEKQEIEDPEATMVFGKKKFVPFVLAGSNIFFVGLRGSGKTTLGKAVAEKLQVPFVDMDTMIQKKAGKSIEEIVVTQGWETFRSLEEECLENICHAYGQVISTGGGVVLSKTNRERLTQHGQVIYLMGNPPLLAKRVRQDQDSEGQRPPLHKDNVEEEMSNQLWEREPLYMMVANHVLQAEKPVEKLLQDVLEALWPEKVSKGLGFDDEDNE